VGGDAPFRAKQVGDTLEWTLPKKALGRPAFIYRYRSAACSVTIWEAEQVAAEGQNCWLVFVRLSHILPIMDYACPI
jgi:hypothetical protein